MKRRAMEIRLFVNFVKMFFVLCDGPKNALKDLTDNIYIVVLCDSQGFRYFGKFEFDEKTGRLTEIISSFR